MTFQWTPKHALRPAAVPGRYQVPGGPTANATPPLDRLVLNPTIVTGGRIDSLAIRTGGAATPGALARLGLYASDVNGDGAALLAETGPIDVSAANTSIEVAIDARVQTGTVWLACVLQGVGTTLVGTAVGELNVLTGLLIPSGLTHLSANVVGVFREGVSGALPATAPNALTDLLSGSIPVRVAYRYGA